MFYNLFFLQVRGITISRLRQIAEYMESLGRRTGIARVVGSGGGIVAGTLTVAGGVLTLLTAGAAAPVLVRAPEWDCSLSLAQFIIMHAKQSFYLNLWVKTCRTTRLRKQKVSTYVCAEKKCYVVQCFVAGAGTFERSRCQNLNFKGGSGSPKNDKISLFSFVIQ